MPRIGKFIETENRIEDTRGWGYRQDGELWCNGYRIFVWVDEKVLEMHGGEDCTTAIELFT